MRATQGGVSILGLLSALFVVIIVALLGMKVVPAIIEFRTAKNAIDAISREQPNGTPADIRRAFSSRSAIDDITAVRPEDLEITKDGSQTVIGFAYRKEVPLSAVVGLYFDFKASTGGQ